MLLLPSEYFMLLNKPRKRIRITKSFSEAYFFLRKNPDAQIRRIGHTAISRVLNKKDFVIEFARVTENKQRFFDLVNLLVKGYTNQIAVIMETQFSGDEFREYLNDIQNV